jgi:S-adenosylmethionine-dependent methyltransferase
MGLGIEAIVRFGGRWRVGARRIYSKLAALTGRGPLANRSALPNLTLDALAELEKSLRHSYFNRQPPGYLETERGKEDLANHLSNRLQTARVQIMPWLESVRRLNGIQVLEVGCGTGSDVVALGERGAHVIAVDVDEGSLQVARKRCELHGVVAELHVANATQIPELIGERSFDMIIFYASLEHMLHEERLRAIADTWAMLRSGDLWCLVETPNRLWHTDTHSALLPFYHWLPDELAFRYSRFSERSNFRECYHELNDERRLHFLRRGRGVSFHEFHIALGALDAFEVVSYKNEFLSSLGWLPKDTLSERYMGFLKELVPELHPAFMQEYLDIILRKP